MSANTFVVGTDEATIQVEAKFLEVHICTFLKGEDRFVEIRLHHDEARELARMINLLATVAEACK